MSSQTAALPVTSYDLVPYESFPYPQSHLDRLATMATLFGVEPPPIKTARVLELACASGGNIIPMACNFPQASFVGVDLSQRQLGQGRSLIEELRLRNINLHHMDLMNITRDFGQFDYIIAHGLFSWVPTSCQEKILEICSQNLSDNGVAYVSYNTYPGWHFRGMIRDMMIYHAGHLPKPEERSAQARALLDFLAKAVPQTGNAYGIMLRAELDLVRQVSDSYLLHDFLEEANDPIYFHNFVERAARWGLQYLADADFSTMLTSNFPGQVGDTLRRISSEIVRTEQYMDFLRNRLFRQTLLVKQNVAINRNLDYRSVLPFLISSPATPKNPKLDVNSNSPETFVLPNGIEIASPQPLGKSALHILSQKWPLSVPFNDLYSQSLARISPLSIEDKETHERQKQRLAADLLTAYAANAVVFRLEQSAFVTTVSERPRCSELLRIQARRKESLTNQLHERLAIDAFGQQLVQLLNGERDENALLDELQSLVRNGALVVQKDGKNVADSSELRDMLTVALRNSLLNMARFGLLVG
jgi:methyltransferase-like protein/ubiquinone/menaquinone biosynthesis C-methylase UbiE